MTQEEIRKIVKEIKEHGKPISRQFFSQSEYAQINVYVDSAGNPIVNPNGTIKTLTSARICQRLDLGFLKLTRNPHGITGDFIDAWKYPPKIEKRGAKIKNKSRKLTSKQFEVYINEIVKEVIEKDFGKEKFKAYLKEKYEAIDGQIEEKFFVQTVIAAKRTFNTTI